MMRIERKKLLAALEPLKPALAVRTVVPAQLQIWFNKKYADAHDGGFGVRTTFETPFDFGVPGKLLINLLEQSEAEEVTLEPKENNLAFKAGKSLIKLAILDKVKRPKFYPDKPESDVLATLKVSKELIAGLRRVFTLRPANPKRLEHHGVCIYSTGKELELYTTDSRALALQPVNQKFAVKRALLPRVFAEQLVAQCEENAVLELHEDHFRVLARKQTMLYSNVLDISGMLDLPSYADRFYDPKVAPPFVIPREFEAALERVTMMVGPKEDPMITLKTSGKKLMLGAEFKSGELLEEFDVDKALPTRSVSVVVTPLLAVPGVDKMMIGPEAVTLCGKDDFLYFLALK
jgi:DNA polymerase III sliding clamp (beta) subunit (PCNA family)